MSDVVTNTLFCIKIITKLCIKIVSHNITFTKFQLANKLLASKRPQSAVADGCSGLRSTLKASGCACTVSLYYSRL